MAKLRVLSGEQICVILAKNRFSRIRQKGSHVIMQKTLSNSTITVLVPSHKEIKIGTLQSIVRQSGILRSEFEV